MKNITHLIIAAFIIAGMAVVYKPEERIVPDNRIYVVSVLPTPVLNMPDFSSIFGGDDGKTLRLDAAGLIRETEFIALPGTLFEVERKVRKNGHLMYEVTTGEYPYSTDKGYYIDRRFVKRVSGSYPEREKLLPEKETIIRNLKAAEGSAYIWGGNYTGGIPEMLSFYPPMEKPDGDITGKWTFKGTDCSGLLYEATGGYTPRNTSSLINFGEPVNISGSDLHTIAGKLEPLDLIVWKGHVVIVLDKATVIESRLKYDDGHSSGVRIQPLEKRLSSIMGKRIPVNGYNASTLADDKKFTIRRWLK